MNEQTELSVTDGSEVIDLFEVMATTRAMRRLKPDPVPDELIAKILQAAIGAANGANRQSWRFMVVKDAEIKARVQKIYKRAFDEFVNPMYAKSGPPPGVTAEKHEAQHGVVEYLTDHFHEAPVWIVACVASAGSAEKSLGVNPGVARMSGASIYPAVQNMLLAARALGLGSTLTTRHLLFAEEADAALGLPEGVASFAILPIGYPMGRFGTVTRAPLSEVVYADTYGEPWDFLAD